MTEGFRDFRIQESRYKIQESNVSLEFLEKILNMGNISSNLKVLKSQTIPPVLKS